MRKEEGQEQRPQQRQYENLRALTSNAGRPEVEEQIVRETREGAGVEDERDRQHGIDDGMEM